MDCQGVDDFVNHKLTCSRNPETAVNCTHGHFKQVFLAGLLFLAMDVNCKISVAQSMHISRPL